MMANNSDNSRGLLQSLSTERLMVAGILALLGLNGYQSFDDNVTEALRINAESIGKCQTLVAEHTIEIAALGKTLKRVADQVDDLHARVIRVSPQENR